MRSKASIKGHSIHQILVPFPVAFFIGAFMADVIVVLNDNMFFDQMAKYLEASGIAFGALAAVPGIIDYFYTVPPESSANKRATQHGLLNVTLLLIFTFALLIRRDHEINFLFVMILEGAGVIILTISGWLGGTLVSRNQIGIDHRYADAGKWQEERIETKAEPVELFYLNKMKTNQMKLMHINGKRIVISKTDSGYAAFEDRCTHRGGSLADGVMICETVQCPWHGSQFNVTTGKIAAGPANENIKIYKIEMKDEKFYLHI
jgi:uncharacterized membrane protein/nitrite reductase/ring-hydroxylating ferredoxin subunit